MAEDLLHLDMLKDEIQDQSQVKKTLNTNCIALHDQVHDLQEVRPMMSQLLSLRVDYFDQNFLINLENGPKAQTLDSLKPKKSEIGRLKHLKTDMEIRPSFSEGQTHSQKTSAIKGNFFDLPFHSGSVNVLSFRKAKKKKNDSINLTELNKKIDSFLRDLVEEPNIFANKAISVYNRMQNKETDISILILSLLGEVNFKASELKSLLEQLETFKRSLTWEKTIQNMDNLTASFFQIDSYKDALINPITIKQHYTAIMAFKTFAIKFQELIVSLMRRICNQLKKSRIMIKDREELELFLHTVNKAIDDIASGKQADWKPYMTTPFSSQAEVKSTSYLDMNLILMEDANRDLNFDFVQNTFEVARFDIESSFNERFT